MTALTTVGSKLVKQYYDTVFGDQKLWQTLLAEDVVMEMPYSASIGHPVKMVGRAAVINHIGTFALGVPDFRFYDLTVYPGDNPLTATGHIKGEGLVHTTGRFYRQEYVMFMRANEKGKIAQMREYYDPVPAAKALNIPVITE